MRHPEVRNCSTCATQRPFEAPTCADGHDPDCPDLACVVCGEAIFCGPAVGVAWAGAG